MFGSKTTINGIKINPKSIINIASNHQILGIGLYGVANQWYAINSVTN